MTLRPDIPGSNIPLHFSAGCKWNLCSMAKIFQAPAGKFCDPWSSEQNHKLGNRAANIYILPYSLILGENVPFGTFDSI